MTRRTLRFYNERPRQFEQDRAAWDDRMMARFEREQDELEVRRDGWVMRTDLTPPFEREQTSQGAPFEDKEVHGG